MDKKTTTQQKILDAAVREFAAQGFDSASTNVIYKQAGVSKGVVFKYFPAKTDLFWSAFDRELTRMVEAYGALDLSKITDPFDQIWTTILWKIGYANDHPEATRVMTEAITRPPKAIAGRIVEKIDVLKELSIEKFFEHLPMDNIRPELSKTDVMRHLRIAIAGLQAVYVTDHPGFPFSETTRVECFEYLKSVYRGMEKNT